MYPEVTANLGGDFENSEGESTIVVDNGATTAYRLDPKGGSQGCKPRCRGPEPLENQQDSAVRPPTNQPGGPDILCPAGNLDAATGGRASLDARFQRHARKRPLETSDSESRGETFEATNTPAASTPSGSRRPPEKRPSKKPCLESGDADEAKVNHTCPFYILDKHKHRKCRKYVFRGLSDVFQHLRRKHAPPKEFCGRCWKRFESHKQLVAHADSPTHCQSRPFFHDWATEEELNTVSNLRENTASLRPRWVRVSRHELFHTLFPDAPRPTFYTADFLDVEDMVSDYVQSQGLSHSLCTGREFVDGLINHMRDREQSDSSDSIPQPGIPQTAGEVFYTPAPGLQPGGLDGQGTFPSMSTHASDGAMASMMEPLFLGGRSFDSYPELQLLEADPTLSRLPEHAPRSTHLPIQDIAGHTVSPGFNPQTGSHAFSGGLPHAQPTLGSPPTAEPLGHGFGMPTLNQTFPPPSDLPQEMYSIAEGTQVIPPGLLSGPNQHQWGPYMGYDGTPGSNFQIQRR